MPFRTPRWVVAAFVGVALPALAPAQYTVETADTPPPKELDKAVRDVLAPTSVRFLKGGTLQAELWFRKEIPAEATPPQLKSGLTYQQFPETTLFGAIRVVKAMTDYRKQKIKPGVYTLRLGLQPMDGDHMGTAPNREFCLLAPAAEDKNPGPLGSQKELEELSTKASGTSHPAVFLLFPNEKPAAAPQLVDKGNGQWVVNARGEAKAGGQTAALGIGLTVVGHSAAE